MKRIICLYGGPGSGKSTTASGVFYRAKTLGLNAELNREYVKNWAWEDRKVKPGDQTYLFAKQSRTERILMEKGVDLVITDSPLVLTHFYGMKYDKFEQEFNTSLIMLKHHHEICKHYGYKVDHYFIARQKEYNPSGRWETEDQAKTIDLEIVKMLSDLGIKYSTIGLEGSPVASIMADIHIRKHIRKQTQG